METHLTIDPVLLDKAFELSGERTRKAAVNMALREFIARREQTRPRELFRQLEWSDDFDCKSERTRS